MKSSILRTVVALACAASLASCGGGNSGTLYLAGTFSGVTVDGLVLQNNGGADLAITGVAGGSGEFRFKDLVPSDSVYNVQIKQTDGKLAIPPNVETCKLTNNTGNTGLYSVTAVTVTCIIRTHALGGIVTGLGSSPGLILINGSNQVPVPPAADGGNVALTMARVSEDYPYGVTVLMQPTGKTCTVTNGVGKMGTVDISNIAVACAPAPGA